MQIAGLILAGGQGRRMQGHDKGWLDLQQQSLIERVFSRFRPQLNSLAISANRNIQRYRQLGVPVLSDSVPVASETPLGPLAGVYTGLCWAQAEPCLACVPCDMPFLPVNLVERLYKNLAERSAVYVYDGRREHYLCCLLATDLKVELEHFLKQGGRAVRHWLDEVGAKAVDFSDCAECFDNINSQTDLLRAAERDSNEQ